MSESGEQDQDAVLGEETVKKKDTGDGSTPATRSDFKDLSLKLELLKAIQNSGFDYPSEVQCEYIPKAISGNDIVCVAENEADRRSIYVLSTLQQLDPVDGKVSILVLVSSRDAAIEINKEFEKLGKFLPSLKVSLLIGGVSIKKDRQLLKTNCPHILIGTPGRVSSLTKDKHLVLKSISHFVVDECDKILGGSETRRDFEEIFKMTPRQKQVMMFSSNLKEDVKQICERFIEKADD